MDDGNLFIVVKEFFENGKENKINKWTEIEDNFLISEIFVENPYDKPSGSVERGIIWKNIARSLNATVDKADFNVTGRSVRDRFKHLRDKAIRKRNVEEKASGIPVSITNLTMPWMN